MLRTFTNAEVVQLLRRLADDIDEPGADEWDGDGIIRVVQDRIRNAERPTSAPIACPNGHTASFRYIEDAVLYRDMEIDEQTKTLVASPYYEEGDGERGRLLCTTDGCSAEFPVPVGYTLDFESGA